MAVMRRLAKSYGSVWCCATLVLSMVALLVRWQPGSSFVVSRSAKNTLPSKRTTWSSSIVASFSRPVVSAGGIGDAPEESVGSSFLVFALSASAVAVLSAARGISQQGRRTSHGRGVVLHASQDGGIVKKGGKIAKSDETTSVDWNNVSNEWEIDCFSRPVVRDGKKMWELMLTDKNAAYRRVAQMKPTRVNSVVVQKLLTIFIEESKVKPRVIRFFRKVMKNMLTVAVNNCIDLMGEPLANTKAIPTRNCHMLRLWLGYREREVYPKMIGYNPPPKKRSTSVQAQMVKMVYEPLPKNLLFSKYAVCAFELSVLQQLQPGQLPGTRCRIPPGIPENTQVYGLLLLSLNADYLAMQVKSLELAAVRFEPETDELLMDLGIDTTYKVCQVPSEEKEVLLKFERSKRQLGGFHFVAFHDELTGNNIALPLNGEPRQEGMLTALWSLIDYYPQDKDD
eukprot:TRINITY_DN40047_c0_g1_i1.p1 TRINITY_DN40047_c0_g1~~TRINITY_DN40047_c0_g1_i1.p1  ORF type:complete len:468 (+),score=39.43 TRINITY_DN40047_c0_g1_i1:48-1406(+)